MRDNNNPSFSSTLLDKIYSSIDYGETGTKNEDLRFYTQKKQSKRHEISSLQRACFVSEKGNADKKKQSFVVSEFLRKSHHEHDLDHDGVFFSSTSISSDSSSGSGCFSSSSDTESMHGGSTKTKASSSCFVRPWLKPVKTRVSAVQPDNKTLKTGAVKCHGDFKKTKQKPPPISPGGRVASFINSLFTTGNTKKPKSSSSSSIVSREKPVSSCSSASSFSRSCLSKNSPSAREKLRNNGVKRTVRFCPVSVVVDEDSRPCGHKCLYEEQRSDLLSVSVSSSRKIRKSLSRKFEEEVKFQVVEKAKRVEEMAREFLKEYHLNHKKNDLLISRDSLRNYKDGEDEEDDASSCSSSDLFELDHHVVRGFHKYEEELPVYETTHVETNRAIANGLIV